MPSARDDSHDLIRGLPGEALLRAGLADLAAGRRSIARCLVHVAWPRLVRAGLVAPSDAASTLEPEHEPELELYRLLRGESGDAYSRYNALLRELVSFELALDRRLAARTRPPETG